MSRGLFFSILFTFIPFTQIFSQGTSGWWSRTVPRFRHVADIEILNDRTFLVIGGNEFNDSITSIFRTTNRGVTWDIISDNVLQMLKDMEFTGTQTGFVVGHSGLVMHTTNFGASWDTIHLQGNAANRFFNGVSFSSANQGVMVGGYQINSSIQTLMRTTDAGLTWSIILDTPGPWLNDIDFADASTGIAVGDSNGILRTTDGGVSWNAIAVAGLNSRVFNSVNFLSATTGFIAGGYPEMDSIQTILKTTDAGATWNIVSDVVGSMLHDIYFYSSTRGHTAGDDGAVLSTTDAGLTWSPVPFYMNVNDTTSIRAIRFASSTFGVLGGRYGKFLIFADTTTGLAPEANGLNTILRDVTLYPNAMQDEINLSFESDGQEKLVLSVTDINGREVQHPLSFQSLPGNNIFTFHFPDLAGGIYYARLSTGEFYQTFKIVVQQ